MSGVSMMNQGTVGARKKIQKRSWTEAEDATLLKLVHDFGTVSSHVLFRIQESLWNLGAFYIVNHTLSLPLLLYLNSIALFFDFIMSPKSSNF